MPMFHVTQTLGRADSAVLEAKSKSDLLTYLSSVSKAVTSSIKLIVYSKSLGINFVPVTYQKELTFSKVLVFCKSKNHSKVFTLYHVKKTVTNEIILKEFKKLKIRGEEINDIYNVQYYK